MIKNKTVLVAFSFGRNERFGYSGIDRYSEMLHKGLTSIGYAHDTYAYGEHKSSIPYASIALRFFTTSKAVKGHRIIHLTQPHGYEAFLWNKARRVLTWHDNLIFTRKSKVQLFNWIRGFTVYATADVIVFNSSQSYNELKEFMTARKNWNIYKTYCIAPLPIDDIWIKEPIGKNIKREGFIYIGAIDYPHKNFKGLIDCYNSICDSIPKPQKPPLHIFTSSPNAREIVDDAETETHPHHYPIILHERADDKEILKQLKKSVALLHLSLEEGYGFPIMESLAVGTPVITLSSAKIPEEVAEWTIRTGEPDREAIKLYNKPKTASAEAIRYAKSLNKENYAKEIVKIYEAME